MTLAVGGIAEPFRPANRAEELHLEVLAFSVSHDHETVRIYGHFPVIEGTKTTHWRYPLREYGFTERRAWRSGQPTPLRRMPMTYGCRLTSKGSVLPLTICLLNRISTFSTDWSRDFRTLAAI
jgi:hypothetical protein